MSAAAQPVTTVDAGSSAVRFPLLDSVRALAAFGILLLHVQALTGTFQGQALGDIFNHGDVGVPVFFVLSGFLLYRPFATAHLRGAHGPSIPDFYRRRFLRIVPVYWFVLAFATVVLGNITVGSLALVARHALLLDTYSSGWVRNNGWMQQTWSLATELAFYAALPLIALLVGLAVRRVRDVVRTELALLAVLGGASFGVAAWLAHGRPSGTVASVWLPAQGYLFVAGMALAVVSVAPDSPIHRALARIAQPAIAWWAVALAAYLAVVFAIGYPNNAFAVLPTTRQQLAERVLYAVVAVAVIVPCAFGGAAGTLRAVLRSRPLRWLGLVSYGIFLWHLDWIKQLQDWKVFTPTASASRFLLVLACTLALTIASAAITWVALEQPLQRFAHRGRVREPVSPAT